MASIGLSSSINAKFLQRLAAASSSSTPSTTFKSNEFPSDSSKINFTSALSFGARSFTSIIKNLNTTVSVVNTSEAKMYQVLDLVKEMKAVIKKSVEPGVGEPARKRLNSEFVDLANKFKNIVVDAKIGDYEILDRDGLATIFSNIGLSPDKSDPISKLFSNFLLRPKDTLLASEVVDNSKDVRIPASAFRRSGSPSYSNGTETNAAIYAGANGTTAGGIATGKNVYAASDDTLIPPTNTIYIKTSTGTTKLAVEAGYDVSLKSVNPTSGYSIIESTQDFMGGVSPLSNPQLFLVDDTGNVIEQLTSVPDGCSFGEAVLSGNNRTTLYSYTDEGTSRVYLESYVSGAGTTVLDPGLGVIPFENLAVSSDGTYAAYTSNGSAYLRDSAGVGPVDATLAALTGVRDIGFLDNNEVAIFQSASGVVTTQDWSVSKIAYGGSVTAVQSNLYGGKFSTLEESSSSGTGYFSIYDQNNYRLSLFDESNMINAFTLTSGDTVNTISMAYNADGDVDVGFAGVISSLSGDTDQELYTLRASGSIAKRSTKYEEIFDLKRTIVRKPDAYRLLADIEDLEKYLNKNIEVLGEARTTLVDNAKVIRATGLAFLSVAQDIRSSDTAESIAERIRLAVRQDARGALAQAQNLDPLIVAALTGAS